MINVYFQQSVYKCNNKPVCIRNTTINLLDFFFFFVIDNDE